MNLSKINKKIGILGGGQLGKMLFQAGSKLSLDICILEKDTSFPAAQICPSFVCGDITNYDDVMEFGMDKDVITIEIESVNIDALEELERLGKKVYPQPAALKIIKDKGLQKMFYEAYGFPTSEFELFENSNEIRNAVKNQKLKIPFVQKARKDGYDGKGVHIIRKEQDLNSLLEGPCLVEKMVDIEKEIAIIIARNEDGQVVSFPAVEMHFHPTANLVEYLFCPSEISSQQEEQASELAKQISEKLNLVGLLAVEIFITKSGDVLINEVAPRPHNSGHHSIEACVTSQYEMHLRAILNLDLGNSELIRPAVMVNLLGEENHVGLAHYQGLEKCLSINGVYPHIYGKTHTKPFRKMGHVTIVDIDLQKAIETGKYIQENLKVISK